MAANFMPDESTGWQYAEVNTLELDDMKIPVGDDYAALRWRRFGPRTSSNLTDAFKSFHQTRKPQEVSVTTFLGTYKWNVVKMIGEHILLHHKRRRYFPIVLKPVAHHFVLATMTSEPPTAEVVISPAKDDPGRQLFKISCNPPVSWGSVVEQAKLQLIEMKLVTPMDFVTFIYKYENEIFQRTRCPYNQMVVQNKTETSKGKNKPQKDKPDGNSKKRQKTQ